MTSTATLRVLLVERSPAGSLVQQTLQDLREAASLVSLLQRQEEPHAAALAQCDVVLLSVACLDEDGLDMIRRAREAEPHIPVIVLTCDGPVQPSPLHDVDDDLLLHSDVDRVQLARSILFALERVRRRQAEQALQSAQVGLRIAREIQFRQLPLRAPRLAGFDLGGVSVAAELVDGDYFDFMPFSDGTWGIVVADACGHGVGAAMLVAQTRACLRALALTTRDLGHMLATANELLAEDLPPDRFVTLLLARLDPRTRQLQYASAGHPTAYVLDAHGRLRASLTSTGFPLGIVPHAPYPCGPVVTLEPGEVVLMVSDGVQESEHEGECFGVERLLKHVAEHRGESAEQIAQSLCDRALAFIGERLVSDDLTAVVLRCV